MSIPTATHFVVISGDLIFGLGETQGEARADTMRGDPDFNWGIADILPATAELAAEVERGNVHQWATVDGVACTRGEEALEDGIPDEVVLAAVRAAERTGDGYVVGYNNFLARWEHCAAHDHQRRDGLTQFRSVDSDGLVEA